MESEGAPVSWEYGPLFAKSLDRSFDQRRRLSGACSENGWEVVQSLQAKHLVLYGLGLEPWLNFILTTNYSTKDAPQLVEARALIARCSDAGIRAQLGREGLEGTLRKK